MRLTTLLTIAGAMSFAHATKFTPEPFALVRRQGGDSFIPGSTPVGSTCPSGSLECGARDCIIPSRGDSCCKEGYGCPGGSFCLTQGYCCPDGDDPKDCAAKNGVSLPAGFNTSPVPASSASQPSASSSSSAAAVATPSSAPAASTPAPSTPASTPPPYPTSSSTKVIPVGTGTGSFTVPPTSLFTGGVDGRADIGGGLAFILGVVAYFL